MKTGLLIFFAALLPFPFFASATDAVDGHRITFQPGVALLDTVPPGATYANIHVRAVSPARHRYAWGLVWDYIDSLNYRKAVMSFPASADISEIYVNEVGLEVTDVNDGVADVVYSSSVKSGLGFDNRYNSMKIVADEFSARLYVGYEDQVKVCTVPFSGGAVGVVSDTELECCRADVLLQAPDNLGFSSVPVEALGEYLASSTDLAEGIYEYLDRDIDVRKATLGGFYRFALVKRPGGGYELVYLSGASVQSGKWMPGKVKGVMKPTIFKDDFDLLWLDSDCRLLSEDTDAMFTDNFSILTLRFPLMSSQIRLRRVPQ